MLGVTSSRSIIADINSVKFKVFRIKAVQFNLFITQYSIHIHLALSTRIFLFQFNF